MSIVAIADELGVHPNTVRFHLDGLVGDGQVERVEPGRRVPGRPPLMFRAVPQMDRGGVRRYRMLAEIMAAGLAAERNPRSKALDVGRAWGKRLNPPAGAGAGADAAVDGLVDVLDELGFAPERRRSDRAIALRHCPFLELAEIHAGVVCSIHLGLMQGALQSWAAPIGVDRLEAFAEPDLCLAHLTSQGAAG